MTLKEKFHQWLKTDPFFNENPTLREYQCEQIADNYAIEFAQWVQFHSELWIKYKTEELLEIFKKEEGL